MAKKKVSKRKPKFSGRSPSGKEKASKLRKLKKLAKAPKRKKAKKR